MTGTTSKNLPGSSGPGLASELIGTPSLRTGWSGGSTSSTTTPSRQQAGSVREFAKWTWNLALCSPPISGVIRQSQRVMRRSTDRWCNLWEKVGRWFRVDQMSAEEFNAFQKMTDQQQADWITKRLRRDVEIVKKTESKVATEPKRTKVLEELEEFLRLGGFGRVETEYQFHDKRRWRADFALLDQEPMVLIEYDGIMSRGPSHSSIRGIARDSEKGNEAQASGYRFYRFNAISLGDGTAYEFLDRVLRRIGEEV